MKERKRNRLKNYNYSKSGGYFVTICTKDKINWFGKIDNGEMVLNEYGKIAYKMWQGMEKINKKIELDEFVVMPNHIHGIIVIKDDFCVGDAYPLPQNQDLNIKNKKIIQGVNLQSQNMRPVQGTIMKERKRNRLKNYNYSQSGSYFVTICTKDKINWFGKIDNGEMILNEYGKIAKKMWQGIEKINKKIELDEFVIMPNHVHGIINIFDDFCVGDAYFITQNKTLPENEFLNQYKNLQSRNMRPVQDNKEKYNRSKMLLSKMIQLYKSSVMRQIKRMSTDPNKTIPSIWQRSFYDHIIRSEKAYENIRTYIYYNPVKWEWDIENKLNKNTDTEYYLKLFK